MRSYHSEDPWMRIHHHGDMSGEALIFVRDMPMPVLHHDERGEAYWEITLPCKPLAEFSRRATISEVVSLVENMD
jgi:hypothetical protein